MNNQTRIKVRDSRPEHHQLWQYKVERKLCRSIREKNGLIPWLAEGREVVRLWHRSWLAEGREVVRLGHRPWLAEGREVVRLAHRPWLAECREVVRLAHRPFFILRNVPSINFC
jgi:hypothetical protein